MSAVGGGVGFQGFGALSTRAGAGGAIATKENRDVGGVGIRIGLMGKALNRRVSALLFVSSFVRLEGY